MSRPFYRPSGLRRFGPPYIPLECMALRMLEHMAAMERDGPFTVYRLMRFHPGRSLRRDRVRDMLRALMERGWVEEIPGSVRRYRATEDGKRMLERSRDVLSFMFGCRRGQKINP